MGRGGGAGSGKSGRGGRGFSSHRSSGPSSGRKPLLSGGRSGSFPSHRKSSPPPRSPRRSSWGSPPPGRSPWGSPSPGRSPWGSPSPGRSSWGSPPPGGYRRQRTGGGCCGNFSTFVFLLFMIFLVAIVSLRSGKVQNFVRNLKQTIVSNDYNGANSDGKVEVSNPREKLAAEKCLRTELVLQDELHWISDLDTVKQAMETFYEKTGVQPYLYICDNIMRKGEEITDEQAESYLRDLYNSMYEDEGHMIFVFLEYAASEYITYLYTGTAASAVIDESAREIFLTNAFLYYTYSSLSYEYFFAMVFE